MNKIKNKIVIVFVCVFMLLLSLSVSYALTYSNGISTSFPSGSTGFSSSAIKTTYDSSASFDLSKNTSNGLYVNIKNIYGNSVGRTTEFYGTGLGAVQYQSFDINVIEYYLSFEAVYDTPYRNNVVEGSWRP